MSEKTVLIIDDDLSNLKYVANCLEYVDTKPHTISVSSPEDALGKVINHKPDVIITDFRMNGMNGLQMMQMMRAMNVNSRFILMTAFDDPQLKQTAQELGVFRYLTKPAPPKQIIATVSEALAHEYVVRLEESKAVVVDDPTQLQIREIITKLHKDQRPEMVIVAHTSGQVVSYAGLYNDTVLNTNALVALVAGCFASASELDYVLEDIMPAATIDDDDIQVNTLYQEGRNHLCFSVYIGREFFLSSIFSKRNQNRMGVIWLAMQRAAKQLREIVVLTEVQQPTLKVPTETQFDETVMSEFKNLFKNDLGKL